MVRGVFFAASDCRTASLLQMRARPVSLEFVAHGTGRPFAFASTDSAYTGNSHLRAAFGFLAWNLEEVPLPQWLAIYVLRMSCVFLGV